MNVYDTLAYLLCDGSILESGHRDTCYIPMFSSLHESASAAHYIDNQLYIISKACIPITNPAFHIV